MPSQSKKSLDWLTQIWLPMLAGITAVGFVLASRRILSLFWSELGLGLGLYLLVFLSAVLAYHLSLAMGEEKAGKFRLSEILGLAILLKLYLFLHLPKDLWLSSLRPAGFFMEPLFVAAFLPTLLIWRAIALFGRDLIRLSHYEPESPPPLSSPDYDIWLQSPAHMGYQTPQAYEESLRRFLRLAGVLVAMVLVAGQNNLQAVLNPSWARPTLWSAAAFTCAGILLMSATYLFKLRRDWEREGAEVSGAVRERWLGLTSLLLIGVLLVGLILPMNFSPIYWDIPATLAYYIPALFGFTQETDRVPIVSSGQSKGEQESLQTEDPEAMDVPTWLATVPIYAFAFLLAILGLILVSIGKGIYATLTNQRELYRGVPPIIVFLFLGLRSVFLGAYMLLKGLLPKKMRKMQETADASRSQGERAQAQTVSITPSQVRELYRELLLRADQVGLGRRRVQTAQEYSKHLGETIPEQAQEIRDLTSIYQLARYSQTQVGEEENEQAVGWWKRLVTRLKAYRT